MVLNTNPSIHSGFLLATAWLTPDGAPEWRRPSRRRPEPHWRRCWTSRYVTHSYSLHCDLLWHKCGMWHRPILWLMTLTLTVCHYNQGCGVDTSTATLTQTPALQNRLRLWLWLRHQFWLRLRPISPYATNFSVCYRPQRFIRIADVFVSWLSTLIAVSDTLHLDQPGRDDYGAAGTSYAAVSPRVKRARTRSVALTRSEGRQSRSVVLLVIAVMLL